MKYDGEYSYGEKNGKCIEYDNNRNLIVEGEFLKGKWIEKNFLYFNKVSN